MKPELLAPANLKTLSAAVQAGADAVYLGGNEFGARKFAENFDLVRLEEAVDFCHLRGVKVYLTANILISDSETGRFLSFIKDAYNLGIDAFILQDIGMATLIKERLPNARIHASTQLTVHNTEGAAFMKKLGFERVVTARELSREDIFEIAHSSGAETEIFVHGALCMSYSGQCLMSSMFGGRSGNRGSCAQPCRLPYEICLDGKIKGKGYYLSPRDLSLAGNMTDVLETGVSSLKIEGRMKGPEYVAAAVSVFRKLIDESRNADAEEISLLENAFSRNGFTSGAFGGDFSRYINSDIGNDDIYKNRDAELLKGLKIFTDESANIRRVPVSFEATAVQNEKLCVSASLMGFSVSEYGEVPEKAKSRATDKETIAKQLSKTGDYPFFADKINILTDGEIFLPLSEINSLRRKCLDGLEDKIISYYKRNEPDITYTRLKPEKRKTNINLAAMVLNKQQLAAAKESGIERIFAPCEIASAEDVAVFPDIIHNTALEKYKKLLESTKCKEVYTANLAIIQKAIELGKAVVASPALNVFNSESIAFWQNFGMSEIILSQELNIKQIEKISSGLKLGAIVYGRAPMMKTLVCPIKSAKGKCGGQACRAYLKDRKNEEFPVVCNGMTTFVLNSKPIYMAEGLKELERSGIETALISFTVETADECKNIVKAFLTAARTDIPFTRGHFYRGVT